MRSLFERLLQEPGVDRMLELVQVIVGEHVVDVSILQLEIDRHSR